MKFQHVSSDESTDEPLDMEELDKQKNEATACRNENDQLRAKIDTLLAEAIYRDVELTKLRADTWRAHYDMIGRTNAHVDFGWMEAGTDEQTTAPRLKKAAECRKTDQEALMLSDPEKWGVKL